MILLKRLSRQADPDVDDVNRRSRNKLRRKRFKRGHLFPRLEWGITVITQHRRLLKMIDGGQADDEQLFFASVTQALHEMHEVREVTREQ
jgi:hypothetical protein